MPKNKKQKYVFGNEKKELIITLSRTPVEAVDSEDDIPKMSVTDCFRECDICNEEKLCDFKPDPWHLKAYRQKVMKWFCKGCFEAVDV